MAWFPLLGFGSFVIASLVAGGRLLLLARRTRQAPEAALGAALFLGGGIGWALLVFGLKLLPAAAAPAALLTASLCLHAGAVSLAAGTAHMFRPRAPAARAAVVALAALFAVSFALRLRDPGAIPSPGLVFWTSTLGGAICYGWSAVEAARWSARLRRQARLSLVEPATARRMGLWALACVAAVAIHIASAANRFVMPDGMHPVTLASSSLLGLGAAICLWLAFFRHGRARAAADSEAALSS